MRNNRTGQFDRLKSGVGRDGTSNAFARGKEPSLAVHHDPNVARADDANHGDKSIARNGAPKRLHPVSVHNGMTARQQALKGMQHANATAPDANPASPLSKEPSGKAFVGTCAPVNPGIKGAPVKHLPELGAAILAEAFCNK